MIDLQVKQVGLERSAWAGRGYGRLQAWASDSAAAEGTMGPPTGGWQAYNLDIYNPNILKIEKQLWSYIDRCVYLFKPATDIFSRSACTIPTEG
jgi:hypothetical protein